MTNRIRPARIDRLGAQYKANAMKSDVDFWFTGDLPHEKRDRRREVVDKAREKFEGKKKRFGLLVKQGKRYE